MNKTILNVALFTIAFLTMYCFAYPFYTGGGLGIIEKKSILQLQSENKELSESIQTAKDLSENAKTEGEAFSKVPQSEKARIDAAIPTLVDVPRSINDINQLAKDDNLIMADIRFTKFTNSRKTFPGVSTYDINFSVKGDYLNFKTFIRQIEQSLEIYTIKNISFNADAKDESGRFKFNVNLETYEIKK